MISYVFEWTAVIREGGTQQMLIFPTCRVVFQEEVKLIGHTSHRDGGNMSSYGNNAVLDAIILRHIFMHSYVDLDTLRDLFGVTSQCTNNSSSADVLTTSCTLLCCTPPLQFRFKALLKIQLLTERMSNS